MPLTVIHRNTFPVRRPLDGFAAPGLGLVERDGSMRPRRSTARSGETETPLTEGTSAKKPATVLNIASHRLHGAGLFRPTPRPGADAMRRARAQRLMLAAAITPPAVWVGHAILHWLKVL